MFASKLRIKCASSHASADSFFSHFIRKKGNDIAASGFSLDRNAQSECLHKTRAQDKIQSDIMQDDCSVHECNSISVDQVQRLFA